MLNKKQFTYLCEQLTNVIKQLKTSNDKINKGLGIQSPDVLLVNIQSQTNSYNFMVQKAQSIIRSLEKNYLDPDSARKMGTIKQQFNLQKNRRDSILKQVHDQIKDVEKERTPKITPFEFSMQNYRVNEQFSKQKQKSQASDRTQQTRRVVYEDFDFQIEHKLASQRHRDLTEVEASFNTIHSISQQTLKMAVQQGQNLTLISDHLIKSQQYTKSANQQLLLASTYQKKANKKYVWCTLIILVVVAIVICLMAI